MLDTSRFDLPRLLQRVPLFGDLAGEEIQRLAAGSTLQRFDRGDAVFNVGDPCDHFHIVVIGQVKLFVVSPSGQEKVIEIVGPGHSFAEALVFLGKPCLVNALALLETVLISVSRQTILREIHRDGALAMRMLAGLSRRLHGLVRDVEAYALQSGVQRVIGYLLRHHEGQIDHDAATVSLPVSKAIVASRLSLTPEYFSRVLRELEAAGLIEMDKRDIRLLDPARLADYPN